MTESAGQQPLMRHGKRLPQKQMGTLWAMLPKQTASRGYA